MLKATKNSSGGIPMKKILAPLLCLCLALSCVGCGTAPAPDQTSNAGNTPGDLVTTPSTEPYHSDQLKQPMHAISMVTVSEDTLADDGEVIFTRSYQKIGLILNGKDTQSVIAADLNRRTTEFLSDTADMVKDAKSQYAEDSEYWSPYFMDISYTPTRIDQSVLSLFCNYIVQSGGVHPFQYTDSITYDLSSGKTLKLTDILEDNCTGSNLSVLVEAALEPMAEELYFDYQDVVKDIFSSNLSSITNWYFSHTGLCFHFAPYEIAPYSSGTIIATIPYDQLEGILREEFFPTELEDANGSLYAEFFLPDDTERFTFLAEVTLDAGGTKILIHPDAAVTDVRIEQGDWTYDGSKFIPVSTIFAADSLGLGNGIVLTADLSSNSPPLRLVYSSGGQEVSAIIVYDEAGDSIQLAHG
jgi:hypothetical protein